MLLKICLILAILIGLATLGVAHFQVGDRIKTLNTDLATSQGETKDAREDASKAKKLAADTKTQLDLTSKQLGEATNTLATVSQQAAEQKTRADKATTQLTAVTEERNVAQQELAAWKVLGVTIDQVRTQRDDLRKSNQERDVYISENKALLRSNKALEVELDRYRGVAEKEVVLPPGTKGKIIAVDPKYNFVVLDVGSNQGIEQNAKMLVNRNGKLVAKVKITAVEPNRSIANVMPEWQQDEIVEGDQVLY
jgi:hypothetical protein